MNKEFNVTGVCIPRKHYMVDISEKLQEILKLIEKEQYFSINKARQYGKTTTLSLLEGRLLKKGYEVIFISFEGIGDNVFENESVFCKSFLRYICDSINFEYPDIEKICDFISLSKSISSIIKFLGKNTVLIIDEVDKSSNNQMFLSFLGMLRQKYLMRNLGKDTSFTSVIPAGVYDVKNLKLKLLPNDERKFNSPWNISADFDVEMSFSAREISSMLVEYEKDNKIGMSIDKISNEIYRFTSGYPFLVSKLCKIIDEKLCKIWSQKNVELAVKMILNERNTLFDDLVKNIENNLELYSLVFKIALTDERIPFSNTDPIIEIGFVYGMLREEKAYLMMHNIIFAQLIYNHMTVAMIRRSINYLGVSDKYIIDEKLNMELVLNKFQEVMHDEYREKDTKFIEREGRLLFLCFLKPIINGVGFYYVESETRMDNRMDVVVTYGEERHIIELKILHGENYEQEALVQLAGYLESKRENKGYLISFCFNKNKEYTKKWKHFNDKDIYAITV